MKRTNLKLYCFSPLVMISTFLLEGALAAYVVARYKMNLIGRLAVALLVFLAVFQIAEYNVCAGGWVDSVTASRVGYVAITMLPPLGIHLAYAIAGAKKRPLLLLAYITAAGFIAFFLGMGSSLTGHECTGNYVIFQMAPEAAWMYGVYYYGWLLAGIGLALRLVQPKTKAALYGLIVGYLVFLIPTATANFIDPETIKGIPSIMCGFAVIFALILTFWILPKAGKKR